MQYLSLAIDDREMIVPNLGDQKLNTVPTSSKRLPTVPYRKRPPTDSDRPPTVPSSNNTILGLNKTNPVLLNGNIQNNPVIQKESERLKESTRSRKSTRSGDSVQPERSSRSNDTVYRIPDRSNRSESSRNRKISSSERSEESGDRTISSVQSGDRTISSVQSGDRTIPSVKSELSSNKAVPGNKTERHGYKKKGGKSIRREGNGNIILLDTKERLYPDKSVMREKISNPAISKISEEVSVIKRELDRIYKENKEYKEKYEQLLKRQGKSNRSSISSRLSDYSERSDQYSLSSNESTRSSRFSVNTERSGRSSRLSNYSERSVDESINIDNMERTMYNENVVRVIPVKINRQMRFETHKKNRRILLKLWGELRGKYNHVYNTALQYGMDVLQSRLINYDIEDFRNEEIVEFLEELYTEYSQLRESTNNEFRYSAILKGINLFYHLVCMGVSYLWDINTQPILDAILSNMNTHKTLIRQIKIKDFFGDQQEAAPESNERIMMKLLAFIVINVIIVIMLSKFTNLQQYLSFIGGSEKVASEISESVGKTMTTNSIVPPTFLSSLTGMFSLFAEGQNNQGNAQNNKRSSNQRSKPTGTRRNHVDDTLSNLDIEEED